MNEQNKKTLLIVLFSFLFAAILVFVLGLGPTYEKVTCDRERGTCEVTESYFFGLRPARRLSFPIADLAEARIRRTTPPVGNRRRPPMTLELVFKDGRSYPTIDFGARPWAEKEVARFNAWLADPSARTYSADTTLPTLAALAFPLLFVGALLAAAAYKRKK